MAAAFRQRGLGGWITGIVCLLALAAPSVAGEVDPPAGFFDPLATITPGISRELVVLLDHIRADDGRRTQPSVRLQYPVLSWLQFSLEMPAVLIDRHGAPQEVSAGDLVLASQACVFAATDWLAEIDVGLELTLPTGDREAFDGNTALRPFVAAGARLGSVDLIGGLGYRWIVAGPAERIELFEVTLAAGYRTRWITPFAELGLLKPVRGVDERALQVTLLPGLEIFFTPNLSLSAGVQLPVGQPRVFDQRVLAALKWLF